MSAKLESIILHRLNHCLDVDTVIHLYFFPIKVSVISWKQSGVISNDRTNCPKPLYTFIPRRVTTKFYSAHFEVLSQLIPTYLLSEDELDMSDILINNYICIYAKYLFSEQMFQGWLVNE
jgi:hypothetical protein